MGKIPGKSSGVKREPYNQPIRFYGVSNVEVEPRSHRDLDSVRRRLLDERAGLTIDERVGRDIRHARELVGMSIEQVARRLKMSTKRVKRIEAGKGRLTVRLVLHIAGALGCRLKILIARA